MMIHKPNRSHGSPDPDIFFDSFHHAALSSPFLSSTTPQRKYYSLSYFIELFKNFFNLNIYIF